MKRLLCCALLLLTFLPTPLPADNKLLASVRPLYSMRPNYETGEVNLAVICTTTSINQQQGYWLTAAHCIDEEVFIEGERVNVIYKDQVLDLAVLRGKRAPALKLAKESLKQGDRVWMLGHPLGHEAPQLFRGYVSHPDSIGYMWFDMGVCGGNSGSSVVNTNNEIVSVMQVGYGRPCTVLAGGSPWRNLNKWVKRYFQ